MGLVDASKSTCKNILGGPAGRAIMLVVGGAQESLDSKKGTYTLTLYHKGFVRQACLYGAHLVPVISFGETDTFELFDNEPGTTLRKFQDFIKKITGIAPAFFKGRAIFNRDEAGLLPYRAAITSVVGAPIKCPKIEGDPNSPENVKIIDEYHMYYMTALKALWEKYKNEFAKKRRGSIQFKEDKFHFIEPITRTPGAEEDADDDGEKSPKPKDKRSKKAD